MGSLAVVFTIYRRPWALDRIEEALRAQTRPPDRLWVIWEDEADGPNLVGRPRDFGCKWLNMRITPGPGENPLVLASNLVLDIENADYIAYLTDDSLPHPEKYERMARALDENPDWGIVYCSQDYGTVTSPDEWLARAAGGSVRRADSPEPSPYCRVDHTQVMHRRSATRWPEDAPLRLSDAYFFRDLVAELGPMQPVPEVLDWTRQLPDGISNR